MSWPALMARSPRWVVRAFAFLVVASWMALGLLVLALVTGCAHPCRYMRRLGCGW